MYLHKHHLDNVIICRGGESVTKGHIRRVEIPRDGTSISVFVLYYLMMICVTRLCDFSKFWQNIYIKNCQNNCVTLRASLKSITFFRKKNPTFWATLVNLGFILVYHLVALLMIHYLAEHPMAPGCSFLMLYYERW